MHARQVTNDGYILDAEEKIAAAEIEITRLQNVVAAEKIRVTAAQNEVAGMLRAHAELIQSLKNAVSAAAAEEAQAAAALGKKK